MEKKQELLGTAIKKLASLEKMAKQSLQLTGPPPKTPLKKQIKNKKDDIAQKTEALMGAMARLRLAELEQGMGETTALLRNTTLNHARVQLLPSPPSVIPCLQEAPLSSPHIINCHASKHVSFEQS